MRGHYRVYLPAAAWVVILLWGSVAAQAATREGIEAYQQGRFERSYQALAEASNQGDAAAQYYLARLYSRGAAVEKDPETASAWFRKAAVQGHAPAQYSLGLRYAKGYGVTRSHIRAYAWLDLAAEKGVAPAARVRDRLATHMTGEQLDAARLRKVGLEGELGSAYLSAN